MNAQNISPGMRLWGVVAEVNEKDLVISLPGGLRGLARATDALDPVLDAEVEVFICCRLLLYYDLCYATAKPQYIYFLFTRIVKAIFQVYSMLGSWFLALFCSWMMTRKRMGNERSGFLCAFLCCIKALPWMLFKKEWYVT